MQGTFPLQSISAPPKLLPHLQMSKALIANATPPTAAEVPTLPGPPLIWSHSQQMCSALLLVALLLPPRFTSIGLQYTLTLATVVKAPIGGFQVRMPETTGMNDKLCDGLRQPSTIMLIWQLSVCKRDSLSPSSPTSALAKQIDHSVQHLRNHCLMENKLRCISTLANSPLFSEDTRVPLVGPLTLSSNMA